MVADGGKVGGRGADETVEAVECFERLWEAAVEVPRAELSVLKLHRAVVSS